MPDCGAGAPSSRLARARRDLAARTPRSAAMARDRAEVVNGAMAASGRAPPPIFIESSGGCRFTDLDGNVWLDLCMGFGVHLLGYNHPVLADAIRERAGRGWHFSLRCPEQLDYARLIRSAAPGNERVVFCNTGTEATLYAMRAARAFSGREKIARFAMSYHGAHDGVLFWPDPSGAPGQPRALPLGHGIPAALGELAPLLPWRDAAAFDLIEAHAHDLAAVMVEPVQGSLPEPDVGDFLHELRACCDRLGVLLIADEVLTGFRLAFGGAQERFGFTADLTAYGKAAAGGMPVGIVTGRADVMACFSDFTEPRGIFFAGTFSGNPLAAACGSAVLGHLREHPEIYRDFERRGDRLRAGFNALCEQRGYPVRMIGIGSMFQIFFRTPDGGVLERFGGVGVAEDAFCTLLLDAGVFIHATRRCFLSAAHGDAEIDHLLAVFADALAQVEADGLFAMTDAARQD